MSAPATPNATTPAGAARTGEAYQTSRLFWISCLALCMAGIANALRTDIASDIESAFLIPIDPLRSGEMVGTILGVPFLAFAITIALSSPLLDVIGMKWLLPLAALLIPSGMLVLGFAGELSTGDNIYWVLWSGALIAGIGWGLVETVMNPLIASLYPTEKTAKLNAGHAWWPAGLVIGGLLGYFMTEWGFDWRFKLIVLILPGLGVLAMSMGLKYPPTERKAAGVSAGRMFRELANPMFVILFLSMFLTAAAELAPGSWVDFALSRTVGMPGHPAAGLRERADVCDAELRGSARASAVADRRVVVLVPRCGVGAARAELCELAGDGVAGCDAVGRRRLLPVADDAGDHIGTIPARGRVADGIDGNGGDAVDPVRAAVYGVDL